MSPLPIPIYYEIIPINFENFPIYFEIIPIYCEICPIFGEMPCSGGPFINFVEIWLNELLGLTVFGVRCSDCYVISICCDLYVFWGERNVRSVNIK